jgi:hypothetical protein
MATPFVGASRLSLWCIKNRYAVRSFKALRPNIVHSHLLSHVSCTASQIMKRSSSIRRLLSYKNPISHSLLLRVCQVYCEEQQPAGWKIQMLSALNAADASEL